MQANLLHSQQYHCGACSRRMTVSHVVLTLSSYICFERYGVLGRDAIDGYSSTNRLPALRLLINLEVKKSLAPAGAKSLMIPAEGKRRAFLLPLNHLAPNVMSINDNH